ncbi:MAG: recombinase family protein [Alistipes sp.]|nr:recombinase family protein [Alistipes sp.]
MTIAYLRVSTEKQTLANQQNEIEKFAACRELRVDRWVTEVVSGKKRERERKLGIVLRRLRPGDTLIVTELSRLSRTLTDIMAIVGDLLRRGIRLYSTKDRYYFDDTINSKVLCFAFGLVAEIERNLISMRTREALALRREQGIVLGRRRGSYTKLQRLIDRRREIVRAMNCGQSIVEICRQHEVSRNTFSRFRQQYTCRIPHAGKVRYRINGPAVRKRYDEMARIAAREASPQRPASR